MEGDKVSLGTNRVLIRFNPRPRMEGDKENREKYIVYMVFQSTPPHGGRP